MSRAIQVEEAVRHQQQTPADVAKLMVHTGRTAVLARARALEELAGHSGQPGAMHGLAFVLDQEYAARKIPHLVCFHDKMGALVGSVLLLEYRAGGLRTGILATGDSFGVRTVIGPEALRPKLAAEACSAMLGRGASMVLTTFKQPLESEAPLTPEGATPGCLWAVQTRPVQDHLPLAASYDATLAQMGKRTRTHLRYYRKRLESVVPCAFHEDARALIDANDDSALMELNLKSLKPLPQATFNLQFRTAASLPGGFISGLQTNDGVWLSLAGGWRQGHTTWVQWQSNATGYEEYSLSTVLRSYLIEQEVRRGATVLAFHGGTSHSMRHAFPVEQVVDLIARRPLSWSEGLVRLLPTLYRVWPSLATRGNFLADVLSSRELRWLEEEELRRIGWPPVSASGGSLLASGNP